MVCAVIDAISGSTLTRLDEMSSRIGASIHISLEHYLGGICQSLSELTRLSRNRVIRQDHETPIACFRFASYTFDGLKQLNLKNDFLRKKYDGVKYDVNHLENIMYDLTIRGLTTNNNKKRPAESDIAPPSRKANNKDQMVLSLSLLWVRKSNSYLSQSVQSNALSPGRPTLYQVNGSSVLRFKGRESLCTFRNR